MNMLGPYVQGLSAGNNVIGQVNLASGGNTHNDASTVFWNNQVVLAAGVSASTGPFGYGKIRIFVQTSVADTFNVQLSPDNGTTWYTLTQDNAGTPLIIATTASQLFSARDIQTFGGTIRLVSIGAATITAGYSSKTIYSHSHSIQV